MPTRIADEGQIRARIDELVVAIRAMDLERAMACYAPGVVSFDIEPPLQHAGAEAKRKNWTNVFSIYRPPLDYEIRDLAIVADGSVAFAHGLVRISGTLTNGHKAERWFRSTTCFRRIDGTWLIAHDHVSAPLDLASGRALLDLQP